MELLPKVLSILIFVTAGAAGKGLEDDGTRASGLDGVIHNPQKISRKEGSSVTLWCPLDPPEDLSNSAADCRQVDEKFKSKGTTSDTVHSYRGGEEHVQPQMPEFINRTHLNLTELKRGIVSVEITSVQTSDSGNYKCFIPSHSVSCAYALTVVEEDPSKGDPSSTGLPPKEGTTPHGGDAETKVDKNIIITAVVVTIVVAVIIVQRSFSNKMEMTPMNGWQETDGHEDPHSTAENVSMV